MFARIGVMKALNRHVSPSGQMNVRSGLVSQCILAVIVISVAIRATMGHRKPIRGPSRTFNLADLHDLGLESLARAVV